MQNSEVYTIKTPSGEISVVAFHDWCNNTWICCPVLQHLPAQGEILLSATPALSAALWGAGSLCGELLEAMGTRIGELPAQLCLILDECWKLNGFGSKVTLPEDQLEKILHSGDGGNKPETTAMDAMRWLFDVDFAFYENDGDLEKAKKFANAKCKAAQRREAKARGRAVRRRAFIKAMARQRREEQ